MGMASSDDEEEIMKEYHMMEKIKTLHPEYEYDTHNMSEDHKAIYDKDLMDRHLQRGSYAPNYYTQSKSSQTETYCPASTPKEFSSLEYRIRELKEVEEKKSEKFYNLQSVLYDGILSVRKDPKKLQQVFRIMKSTDKKWNSFVSQVEDVFIQSEYKFKESFKIALKSKDIEVVRFFSQLENPNK